MLLICKKKKKGKKIKFFSAGVSNLFRFSFGSISCFHPFVFIHRNTSMLDIYSYLMKWNFTKNILNIKSLCIFLISKIHQISQTEDPSGPDLNHGLYV